MQGGQLSGDCVVWKVYKTFVEDVGGIDSREGGGGGAGLSSQRMREVRVAAGDSLSRREDKMGEC